jgi:catechol 2,3-dioxygenase
MGDTKQSGKDLLALAARCANSLYIHDPNGYGVELVYDLPREVWENDIDAAPNFAVLRPNEGAEALNDRTDVAVFGPLAGPSQ